MSLSRPLCGRLSGLALFAAATGSALAHGLDAGRVTVVLRGRRVEVVATPPVAAIAFADTDRDGLLSSSEVNAARPTLRERLGEGLRVTSDAGERPTVVLFDVATPADHGHSGGADHLRVTLQADFQAPPAWLRLEVDFAAATPLAVLAWRADPSPSAGIVQLSSAPERARLDAERPSVRLLGAAESTPTRPTDDRPHSDAERPPQRASGCSGVTAGGSALVTLFGVGLVWRRRRPA